MNCSGGEPEGEKDGLSLGRTGREKNDYYKWKTGRRKMDCSRGEQEWRRKDCLEGRKGKGYILPREDHEKGRTDCSGG